MSRVPKNKAAATGRPLDAETRVERSVLAKLGKMTSAELFALAVRAGIYTEKGKLTRPYRAETGPSACRPTG